MASVGALRTFGAPAPLTSALGIIMLRPILTALFILFVTPMAIATDNGVSSAHREAAETIVDGRLLVKVFFMGLEKGISGGANATIASKQNARRIISRLDEGVIQNKFVEFYVKYFPEKDAVTYARFLKSEVGKKWRQHTLKIVTLDHEGKTQEEIRVATAEMLSQNDIRVINTFMSSNEGRRALQAQRMGESEFEKYIQPIIRKIASGSN